MRASSNIKDELERKSRGALKRDGENTDKIVQLMVGYLNESRICVEENC